MLLWGVILAKSNDTAKGGKLAAKGRSQDMNVWSKHSITEGLSLGFYQKWHREWRNLALTCGGFLVLTLLVFSQAPFEMSLGLSIATTVLTVGCCLYIAAIGIDSARRAAAYKKAAQDMARRNRATEMWGW